MDVRGKNLILRKCPPQVIMVVTPGDVTNTKINIKNKIKFRRHAWDCDVTNIKIPRLFLFFYFKI